MATLFNTKISQTYEGLLKTINNAALSATLRELTDGSGNQSGLFLNTAGDFKVTSVLEWGSLKDTGTGVTITQFVTAANGIENFNNDTTLPTSAAVKLYVDTKFSQTDTLTEVLGFGNTTSGKDIAVSAGDDITFTDTSKILMGASNDLQIYHDAGGDSYIKELGSGQFYIQAENFRFKSADATSSLITANVGGAVNLYYNNSKKFETTNAGAEVTGDLVVTGTITGAGGSFLPLAGGTMTGNTLHGDGVHSYWGNNNDLQIDHDGNHSVFNSLTGNVYFSNEQNDGHIELRTDNGSGGVVTYLKLNGSSGAVELNHYGAVKLATKTYGVEVTGQLISTSNIQVGNNLILGDNKKALFGSSNDLQIYHSGSDSFIHDSGSGGLRILTNEFRVYNEAQTELIINAVQNGAVELYYDNTKRIETVTDGAKVIGNLEVTGTITGAGGSFLPLIGGTMTGDIVLNDGVKTVYGTANDGLWIYHDGNNSYINDVGTGDLYILGSDDLILGTTTGEVFIQCNENSSVELKFNNATKFVTTNTGIAVTGGGSFTGNIEVGANNINFANNGKARFGNQANLQIYSDGSNSFIDNTAVTQSTIFRVSNANSVDTTALTINREGDLITGKDVTIAGDLTVNGTTTTVNSQTLSVVDPLISLATANTANSLDIGFYGKYNDGTARYLGLFNDASDSNKFRLFRGTTVEPTTTVNIGGTGYVAADLVVAGLEATVGTFSGQVNSDTYFNSTDSSAVLSTTGAGTIFLRPNGQNVGTGAFSLNSSGNATFLGNVTLAKAGTPLISLTDTTNNVNLLIGADDANTFFRSSAGTMFFQTGGSTTALTIDASQNATFTGDVILSTNSDILKSGTNPFRVFTNGTLGFSLSASQNATFAGSITATTLGLSGGITANFFRTNSDNADYNLITRDSTGNTVFIQAVQSNTNQPIAKFSYGSGTVNAGNAVFQVSKDNSHFVNCRLGIGNTAPEQLLHIGDGSDAARGVVALEGAGGSHLIFSLLSTETAANAFALRPASGTNFIIQQDGSAESALTIDTGANATFAGEVTISSETQYLNFKKASTNDLLATILGETDAGTGGKLRFLTKRNGDTQLNALILDDNQNARFGGNTNLSYGKGYFMDTVGALGSNFIKTINSFETVVASGRGSASFGVFGNADIRLGFGTDYTAAQTKLTIDPSGNATFAGDVTMSKTYPKLILNDTQGVQRKFSVGVNNETFTLRNETATSNALTIVGSTNAATFGGQITSSENLVMSKSGLFSSELRFQNNTHTMGIDYQNNETLRFITRSGVTTVPITFGMRTGNIATIGGATFGGDVIINNSDARLKGGNATGRIIVSNSDTTSYISLNGSSNASPNNISIITDEEIIFNTGASYTERMRITSAGQLLVGATALSEVSNLTNGHLLEENSQQSGQGAVGVYNNSGTAECPALVVLQRDTSTDSTNRFIQFYSSVTDAGSTAMGGIVGNGASNVQFAAISDIREKENVKTIESSLDKINNLNPVKFDWKKTGEHITAGFIAQEVEEIFPEYVVENMSNEGEEKRIGLTGGMTSGIIAHLVKSIQELTAKVERLEAK